MAFFIPTMPTSFEHWMVLTMTACYGKQLWEDMVVKKPFPAIVLKNNLQKVFMCTKSFPEKSLLEWVLRLIQILRPRTLQGQEENPTKLVSDLVQRHSLFHPYRRLNNMLFSALLLRSISASNFGCFWFFSKMGLIFLDFPRSETYSEW